MPTVSVKEKNKDGLVSKEVEVVLEVQMGETLYDEIAAHGHKLPHGCLSGSCGACRMVVLKGEQFLSPPSEKEIQTLKNIFSNYRQKFGDSFIENKIIRLSCQSKFIDEDGDLEIVSAP